MNWVCEFKLFFFFQTRARIENAFQGPTNKKIENQIETLLIIISVFVFNKMI